MPGIYIIISIIVLAVIAILAIYTKIPKRLSKLAMLAMLFVILGIILIIFSTPRVKEIYCGRKLITSEKPEISISCETNEDCRNKINELNISCKQEYDLHCDRNLCNCILLQPL